MEHNSREGHQLPINACVRKMLGRFYRFYFMRLLARVTIVCGLAGSYIYYGYQTQTASGGRLVLVTLFSTVRLYMASPTVDLTQVTNVLYEIARFLAPVYTAAAIVQLMKKTSLNTLNEICGLWKREQIFIFGYNEKSLAFMDSLKDDQERKKVRIVFLNNVLLDDLRYLELLGKRAVVKDCNLSETGDYENINFLLQRLKIGSNATFVLMSESEKENFYFPSARSKTTAFRR